MKFAAFFRNLNLGRPPAPTRPVFEEAFVRAGASEPRSFLVNGTLVFAARGRREATRILTDARTVLASGGLREPAFLRGVDELASLVADDPFAAVDHSAVHDCYVTFVQDGFGLETPPRSSSRGDVEVIRYTATEMLSVAYKPGKSQGSPNAFAEKHFGVPATTRAWRTVVRLVDRFG